MQARQASESPYRIGAVQEALDVIKVGRVDDGSAQVAKDGKRLLEDGLNAGGQTVGGVLWVRASDCRRASTRKTYVSVDLARNADAHAIQGVLLETRNVVGHLAGLSESKGVCTVESPASSCLPSEEHDAPFWSTPART
jgi:hypothetical protein